MNFITQSCSLVRSLIKKATTDNFKKIVLFLIYIVIKFIGALLITAFLTHACLTLLLDPPQSITLPIVLQGNHSLAYLIKDQAWEEMCSNNQSIQVGGKNVSYYCKLDLSDATKMLTRKWTTQMKAYLSPGQVQVQLIAPAWSEQITKPVLAEGWVVLLDDLDFSELVLIKIRQPGTQPRDEKMKVEVEHSNWGASVIVEYKLLLCLLIGTGMGCLILGLSILQYIEWIFELLEDQDSKHD